MGLDEVDSVIGVGIISAVMEYTNVRIAKP